MKIFEKNYLKIKSDFPIKVLNSSKDDEDLIINLDSRVVNLVFDGLEKFSINRFQLTEVKNILIRHSLKENFKFGTIHFLRVIDLNSSLLNFSLDLSEFEIIISEEEFFVQVQIKKAFKRP